MTLWIDAQLSPHLAQWIDQTFEIESQSVTSLGLRDAEDVSIFQEARAVGAIVMTKDQDFVNLVRQYGPPPQILLVTCGNTSNKYLRSLLQQVFPNIFETAPSRRATCRTE
ncbi:MAG: DUF5615 family PIN-like protein [Nitrospira sp.]|nr:DUF5615 family PIN-like protein [Nitrospira sp.]